MNDGACCFYASDTEIFDYRPRRYKTEGMVFNESEWNKIENNSNINSSIKLINNSLYFIQEISISERKILS